MNTSQTLNQELKQAVQPVGEPAIKKIVVAIHGIGDQYRYATAQSVVTIFSRCFDQAAAVPLGSFYGDASVVKTFRLEPPPEVKKDIANIGFVEFYWADIPRRLQHRGYTIEETKAWARTVVERVRARYSDYLTHLVRKKDYASAAAIIEDLIDGIEVLRNLFLLASKAGLFHFDFHEMLTAYAGDVQIVADFAKYREKICHRFRKILHAVHTENKDAEIYIIAHSEGTVIALMVLLKALCTRTRNLPPPEPRPDWIGKVRGLMTIGSPIDKHLILWTEMWDPVETPDLTRAPKDPIAWRNYYDYGDPVGFRLDTARDWLEDHGWDKIFEFHENDDFGFGRYFLPGKAHNDYWNDPCVFGHFIRDVLKLTPDLEGEKFDRPPTTRPSAKISSYFTPYCLVVVILYSAIFILYTVVGAHSKPAGFHLSVTRNVAGIFCLLFGTTVASRICCLTRDNWWKWFSAGVFTVLIFFYVRVMDPFDPDPENTIGRVRTILAAIPLALIGIVLSIWADRERIRLRRNPFLRLFARGMRPLLIVGGLTVAALIAYRIWRTPALSRKSYWPLLLAGSAFIYLWWLAALLFDLAFTWHRYVRHAVWHKFMRQARKDRIKRERQVREKTVA